MIKRSPSDLATLAPGTELIALRLGYRHHGIYLGDGRVIHYGGRLSRPLAGRVKETTVECFAEGCPVVFGRRPLNSSHAAEVLSRARSRLGEHRYHVLRNNCEHFSSWCLTGEPHSTQVESLFARVGWLHGLWRRPADTAR